MDPHTSIHVDVTVAEMRAQLVRFIEEGLLDVETLVRETVTPEIVNKAFIAAMEKAMEEELDNFFRWGDGRRAVREAVKAVGQGLFQEASKERRRIE